MIDLVDYMILGFFVGKYSIVVWNKMFLNIDNFFFGSLGRYGFRWCIINDFNIIEFDEGGYR